MKKILIVGGGAAGMACGVFLADAGFEVELFEKNEKFGKKIYITGKGRCNFTNDCDFDTLMDSVKSNPKFLYSAFRGFLPQDAIGLFEDLGVRTKVERGNRAFPASDHASDIINALHRGMKKAGVHLHLNTAVASLLVEKEKVKGLVLEDGREILGDAVVVATGGLSYPSTGSTGDGYRFAKESGHTVTETMTSLVPLTVKEEYIIRMQGLSLKNVTLKLFKDKKKVYEGFGEMMFTHFGITGPLVLTASAEVGKMLSNQNLRAVIDWKPALNNKQLDERLLREFKGNENRIFRNGSAALLPQKAHSVFMDMMGDTAEKKIHDVTKKERNRFIDLLKNFPFTITGRRGYNEAVITKGGVKVGQIQPGSMESKLVDGLYFIGEVLDLDALTGGFNLQIAWSTAHQAALALKEKYQEEGHEY